MKEIRTMLLGIAVILFGISLSSLTPLFSYVGGFLGFGICIYGFFPVTDDEKPVN